MKRTLQIIGLVVGTVAIYYLVQIGRVFYFLATNPTG